MKINEILSEAKDVTDETKIRRIVLAAQKAVKGSNIHNAMSLKPGPKGSDTMEFRVQYASNSFPGVKHGAPEDINIGYEGTAKLMMATIKELKKSAPLEFVGLRLSKGEVFMPKSAKDIPAEGDPVFRYVFKSKT